MDESTIKPLIRTGEGSTVEFKTQDVHNDSIAKEIVAGASPHL